MAYNKLSKLGYSNLSNKYLCTSEDYNIYINTLNAQFTKAYSEGVFGALNTARRGVRDTAQFGIQALKKLIELIKKVIGGFIDMCKKVVLEVGNQRQRMTKCADKLKQLENDLSKYKTTYETTNDYNKNEKESTDNVQEDKSNPGETNANTANSGNKPELKDMSNIGTINIVTVASLNISGWNLSEINKNPMRESKLNNTLAWFCKTLADNYELDPYTQLAYSKNFDQLMSRLENMFEIAEKQYDKDEMYYLISVRDKIRKALANLRANVNSLFRQYKYTGLPPKTYGRYVAQAFSPAGAFVTTNPNDSFNRAMKRTKNYLNAMTPNKVAVPLDKAYIAGSEHSMENAGEVTKTLNYLYLVITYLNKIDPLDYFKDKIERIGKLQRQMDVFLKMSTEDMRKAKDANYNNPSFNNDGGKVMSYEDNKKQEQEQQKSFSQSALAIQNALMADLEAFGEEDSTLGLRSNSASLDAARQQQNLGVTGTEQIDEDVKLSNKLSYNRNKNDLTRPDQFRLQPHQMTKAYSYYACQYLQSFLIESGNLVFQEGKFYNAITKLLCDIIEDFDTTVREDLLDDLEERSKKEKDQMEAQQHKDTDELAKKTQNNTTEETDKGKAVRNATEETGNKAEENNNPK